MAGPLAGVKVLEFGAIGPTPFAGGYLADFGADVVRVDRPGSTRPNTAPPDADFYNRSKRSIALDLKNEVDVATARQLASRADVVIEGYRPGVMERLGCGPDVLMAENPALVFARMTGWGQTGPLANAVGHDINYASVTGALHATGYPDRPPTPALNLVADLGGGGMYLVSGVLMALLHARATGKGQVIDVAMVDGVCHMMSAFQAMRQADMWSARRFDNIVDGGSPDYGVYTTADGLWLAVGAMEPQFYAALLELLELAPGAIPDRTERSNWPTLRALFAERFATLPRQEWLARAEGMEICLSAVLSIDEAWDDPHLRARGTFREFAGRTHPAPAPRLMETPGDLYRPTPDVDADRAEILGDWAVETS
ncbi:MAG: CaiB/BaiF CoA transferase family protein [Novosphingobium sp.]